MMKTEPSSTVQPCNGAKITRCRSFWHILSAPWLLENKKKVGGREKSQMKASEKERGEGERWEGRKEIERKARHNASR